MFIILSSDLFIKNALFTGVIDTSEVGIHLCATKVHISILIQ